MNAAATFDAVVIGAGAAGLFCAGVAGQRGLRVLLLDHAERVAEKIRISGGGRCNFTNAGTTWQNFQSDNPSFCRSALARYTAADFVALVKRHDIPFHEKHRGQLFCDRRSEDIIRLLQAECGQGGVTHWQPCAVHAVRRDGGAWAVDTDRGSVRSTAVVVATGGLPVPKIGATDFGLRLAAQFGHVVVAPRPALVPLVFEHVQWTPFAALAGVSLPVGVSTGQGRARQRFAEDLLFTHRGLSGPATLQISTYWRETEPIELDLWPEGDAAQDLLQAKAQHRGSLAQPLAKVLPARLASLWAERAGLDPRLPLAGLRDRELQALGSVLQRWVITPQGTEGWMKAEVMAGGVDTRSLSGQTMESRLQAGLYFIGEVVDVTGWLGGYNFQWAWASAMACAQALPSRP